MEITVTLYLPTQIYTSDVDECSLGNVVTCDENAQCGNTVGGFTCSCATGYSGTGLTCGE